jgi:nucleotide-binding universal stress UspA family protein
MFHKIMLASDGSDGALQAARVAADIAKKFGAELTLFNVFTLPMPVMPMVGFPGVDVDPATVAEYTEKVQDSVSRRTGKVLDEAGVKYEVRREIGHAAGEITRVAHLEHFDLIVIGCRGMSSFQALLLGSVSDRVARHAHCPVLVVK